MKKLLTGIEISEDQILEQFSILLEKSDAYELAELVGNVFGGKCCPSGYDNKNPSMGYSYMFYPDENYKGAFGNKQKGNVCDQKNFGGG